MIVNKLAGTKTKEKGVQKKTNISDVNCDGNSVAKINIIIVATLIATERL